jgi:small RNA 2'-O-methyltransferase
MGCGEGALLSTLCQPAPWLRPDRFADDDEELSSLFWDVGLNDGDTPDLHAVRVAGLDVSSSTLALAAQCTSPASVNPLYTRWEPLDVELWQGSIDAINPAFINVQCIVASEL